MSSLLRKCFYFLGLAALAVLVQGMLKTPVHAADNLIPNPSVENAVNGVPTDWTTGRWGTNQSTFTYTQSAHTGHRAVEVRVQSYTSGDAKWYFTPQPVTPGQRYKFSDYYAANVATQVVAQVENVDGSMSYLGLKNAPAATQWTAYTDYVTVPATAARLTIFHLINRVGNLRTDDFSLTADANTFSTGLVSLTFDDGWDSAYTNVLPMLNASHAAGTFYVPTGFLNQSGRLSLTQLDAIYAAGNEIGDHTVTHPDLTTISRRKMTKELVDSKTFLQARYGPITDFAVPYGAYNTSVLGQIRQYFASNRTTDEGFNSKQNFNQYLIKTQNVEAGVTAAQVEAWVAQAAADHTWLVLVYHQVDDSGAQYGTTPAVLQSTLDSIQVHGLPVMTVRDALHFVNGEM